MKFYKLLGLFTILISTTIINAANIIKNPDFKDQNALGMPKYWDFRGESIKNDLKISTNYLQLISSGEKQKSFLIQRALDLKPGEKYMLIYQARKSSAEQEDSYQCYVGWRYTEKGKTVGWDSSGSSQVIALKTWGIHKQEFQFSAANNATTPYLAINTVGNSAVEFKNIILVKKVDAAKVLEQLNANGPLIKNGELIVEHGYQVPGWGRYRMESKEMSSPCSEGGVILKDASQACLVQRNVPLKNNGNYKVSYEVKAFNDNTEYRVPLVVNYEIDGNNKNKVFNRNKLQASKEWTRNEYIVICPENMIGNYIELNPISNSPIAFRNVKIEEIKLISEKKQFGGDWYLFSGSKFDNEILEVMSNGGSAGAKLQNIPVQPGKKYKLSYSVKGVGKAQTTTGFHPFIIEVLLNDKKLIGKSPWDDVWDNSFQNKYFVFMVPEDAKVDDTITLSLIVNGKQINFKNLEFKEAVTPLLEKYKISIKSPIYRNMIFATKPVKIIEGIVRTDETISAVKINLNASNGKSVFTKMYSNNANEINFLIEAKNLKIGNYKLTATIFSGDKIITENTVEIRKLAKAPMEVVQGEDRNFYINGNVFFPVAIWNLASQSQDSIPSMYYAARRGINLTIRHPINEKQALLQLDEANKYGIKIFFVTGYATDASEDKVFQWQNRMANIFTKKVLTHPAMFGYFLVDEPAWAGVPAKNLHKSYEALKELDPYHPVWINAAPRGIMDIHKIYSQAADVYGLDIYPVPYPSSHSGMKDKGLTSVGKYTEFCYNATEHKKSIFMALQGFSWKDMDDSRPSTKIGYPSWEETRFMVYDSLLNYGSSVGYWGCQHIRNKAFFATLFRMSAELQQMSGLFTRAKVLKRSQSIDGTIRFNLFEYNGKHYAVAINTTTKDQEAVIAGEFAYGEVNVLFENRSISAQNSKLKDKFKPFEVHVYATEALPEPAYTLAKPIAQYEGKTNPFWDAVENKLSLKPYNTNASWIWSNSKTYDFCKATLVKDFDLTSDIREATVEFTADDIATVYINDTKIKQNEGGWSLVTIMDVTKLLKKGKNRIFAEVSDAGHIPCGFLFTLKILFKDGTTKTIISDDSWKGIDHFSDTYRQALSIPENWANAKVIATYGNGRWGRKAKYSPKK
ncbi:MAG: hypothetical protein WCS73_07905 [Lentisphaeria bacterium]